MFHILVVDDNKHTRLLFKAVLEAENYTVFTAEDGEDALRVMDEEHIDLVVLDIMMPKMDGYEFTKILRENLKTVNLKHRKISKTTSAVAVLVEWAHLT